MSKVTGVDCSRRIRQYQVGGSDIETVLPLAIEAKTGYRISVMKALDQAEENALEGELPFVWVKQNRKGTSPARYIAINEEHFIPMLIEYLRNWIIRTDEINQNFTDMDLN
jgi:hypothetical protein